MSLRRYAPRPYSYCRKVAYVGGTTGDFGEPGEPGGWFTVGDEFRAHVRTLSAESKIAAGKTATTTAVRLVADHPVGVKEQDQMVYSDAPIPARPSSGGTPLIPDSGVSPYTRHKVSQVVPYPKRRVAQIDAERTA